MTVQQSCFPLKKKRHQMLFCYVLYEAQKLCCLGQKGSSQNRRRGGRNVAKIERQNPLKLYVSQTGLRLHEQVYSQLCSVLPPERRPSQTLGVPRPRKTRKEGESGPDSSNSVTEWWSVHPETSRLWVQIHSQDMSRSLNWDQIPLCLRLRMKFV